MKRWIHAATSGGWTYLQDFIDEDIDSTKGPDYYAKQILWKSDPYRLRYRKVNNGYLIESIPRKSESVWEFTNLVERIAEDNNIPLDNKGIVDDTIICFTVPEYSVSN